MTGMLLVGFECHFLCFLLSLYHSNASDSSSLVFSLCQRDIRSEQGTVRCSGVLPHSLHPKTIAIIFYCCPYTMLDVERAEGLGPVPVDAATYKGIIQ